MATAENKMGPDGTSRVLADPFFKSVKFSDVINGKTNGAEQGQVEQLMLAANLNEDTTLALTSGQVNIKATASVPVLAFGLTKKVTVAVAVPVLHSSTNMTTGGSHVNPQAHAAVKQQLAVFKGVALSDAEFDEKMSDPVCSKLIDYGYKSCEGHNENKTHLGDIKFVGKVMALENASNRLTIQGDITAPTGKDHDVNEVVDVASGDDQWDIGLGVNHDLLLTDRLTISTGASYTRQLSDKNPERVPFLSTSKVTPYVDLNTERDLGDIAMATVAASYHYEGWSIGTGYTMQYKGEDTYDGSAYPKEWYDNLEKDTRQNMHTVQLTAGYDTITLFKKKKFAAPLKFSINHTRVISGKNVVDDPATTLDFALFF